MNPMILSVVLTGAAVLLGVWRIYAGYAVRNDAAHADLGKRIDAMREELIRRDEAMRDELGGRMDATRKELIRRDDATRTELGRRMDATRRELIRRDDATRTELGARLDGMNRRLDTIIQMLARPGAPGADG